ncbi:MAG: hypothetical protein ACTSQE_02635 [Candidatus Heimdallarchaeaceae archaeon]
MTKIKKVKYSRDYVFMPSIEDLLEYAQAKNESKCNKKATDRHIRALYRVE